MKKAELHNPWPCPTDNSSQTSVSDNPRFTCPGCGNRATADQGAMFCSSCQCFVHNACLLKFEWTSAVYCPICRSQL